MKYRVRCRNSTCRHMRMSPIHPDEYYRRVRCTSCGQIDKGWRIERRKVERPCHCSGYWFAHRPGSLCCVSHPRGEFNQAKRAGVKVPGELMEALIHSPGRKMRPNDPCPF